MSNIKKSDADALVNYEFDGTRPFPEHESTQGSGLVFQSDMQPAIACRLSSSQDTSVGGSNFNAAVGSSFALSVSESAIQVKGLPQSLSGLEVGSKGGITHPQYGMHTD